MNWFEKFEDKTCVTIKTKSNFSFTIFQKNNQKIYSTIIKKKRKTRMTSSIKANLMKLERQANIER